MYVCTYVVGQIMYVYCWKCLTTKSRNAVVTLFCINMCKGKWLKSNQIKTKSDSLSVLHCMYISSK